MSFGQNGFGSKVSGFARIMRKRHFGKISFWTVRFEGKNIQLALDSNTYDYTAVKKIKRGCNIWFEGNNTLTKSDDVSIYCHKIVLEGDPSIDIFSGDQESRYTDCLYRLLNDQESFELFSHMSNITRELRKHLWSQDFKEFATGILRKHWEGGTARPFHTHCNANGQDYILSLTSELKLKSLQVAGLSRIFEISQSFRNEGIDSMHSPEFTLLEICKVDSNYQDMMLLLEAMISSVISEVFKKTYLEYGDKVIDFKSPFRRITFHEACAQFLGIKLQDCNLTYFVENYPEKFNTEMSKFTWVFKVINKLLGPNITNPTFITEIPSGISPLIKTSTNDDSISNRAALIISGIDVADIYEDENDPSKVHDAMQNQFAESGVLINNAYLEVLRHGIPPSSSIGMGLNRFFMTLTGNLPKNIKETILFPL